MKAATPGGVELASSHQLPLEAGADTQAPAVGLESLLQAAFRGEHQAEEERRGPRGAA
eukprot:CAMPEP_0179304894 /NCGR_PEP_ID=MMETSP0797-20121207/49340_1 /TAXON_ID=47934 /ORGANISM="Dinophysis acuminata, Strain DAEP01" /LENGTH=57 /DNA_ID=CAMNT_0021014519 /DNA_START=322 /DNA_END=492 /DNA_ORIENTATION=-